MKPLLAVLTLLLAGTALAQEMDMQKYLSDTEAMVRRGEHKKALKRFEWFHDHALENDTSMVGVRLTFALEAWKQLGDIYPPAMQSLRKTRDEKIDLILKKKGTFHLFADVDALNRTLRESGITLELFRRLDKDQPTLAKQCWPIAKPILIREKQYDLLKKYMVSFTQEFNVLVEKYNKAKALYGTEKFGDAFKKFNERSFVKDMRELATIALAMGKPKVARNIQMKAFSIFPDPHLRMDLPAPEKKKK